jgi:hypothetical protein
MTTRQAGYSLVEMMGAFVVMGLALGIVASVYSKASTAEREAQAVRVVQSAAQAVRGAHPFAFYDQVDAKTLANAAGLSDASWDDAANGMRLDDIGVLSAYPVLSGELPDGYEANTAFEIKLSLGRNPSLCSSLASAFKAQARRVYVVARGQSFVLSDSDNPTDVPGGMDYVASVCRGGGVDLWLTFT